MQRRCVTVGLPLLALLALPACGGDDEASPLELTHLPTDDLSFVSPGTVVIRTPATWTAFWDGHPDPRGAVPAPAVDFARHAVAGVFAGHKPRCQRLEIESGEYRAREVTLRWRIVSFGQSTPSSCIGSDPFVANLADLVLIPADATEVRFVELHA